ncbi:2,5-diketo-D-gluconic acid reductase [Arthrobacter livingstonensis]|uniref:2,5-diketo-D-gluconic acid reductase n=1 Tax=Arthrobacter livingstonensis TaxID=670078 RepID=A0A2V5LNE6_9MICC|nr:aldo/keto reductase [Arthrobacter livingstonensis]PYI69300.1 2,5-diketo-D-gluconic acid reductase [Arthrobacter livingstonensis]
MTESTRSEAAAAVPVLTLNNGVDIPQLGFGVFQIPPEETRVVVGDALAAGYRHIDTAAAYRNEAGVGAAIAGSGIPREEIFVTTKLRNGEQDSPRAAFEASRQALGVDWIDLYLIHWPVPSQGLYTQAWKELESLYAQGLIRAIGVSNFLPEHLDELLANSTVVPAVNQIESHPTFHQPALAQKSRSHGIAVEAYSPLGQGRDLDSGVVTELAAKHGATPAQIVLAWHLGVGNIVIPKSVTPERIRENLAAAAITLSPEELAAVSALESGQRIGTDPAVAAFTQM